MIGNDKQLFSVLVRRTCDVAILLAATSPLAAGAQTSEDGNGDVSAGEELAAALVVEQAAVPVHGMVWSRLRTRSSSDDEDTDLFLNVRLDVGDVIANGFEAHFAGIGFADLDGTSGSDYTFFSVNDTYDHAVQGRLHLAYLDMPSLLEADVFRMGRQQVYSTPEFAWFDGLRFERGNRFEREPVFGAYVGQPVKPYQASTSGELLFGAHGEILPWYHGRVRIDFMRFEDQSLVGMGGNDLWKFDLRQQIMEGLAFNGSYSRLDLRDRDMELALTSYGIGEDLVIRASYFELLEAQSSLTDSLDPFTSTTVALNPYRQGRLLVSKGIGEWWVVESGLDIRRVSEDLDIGEFNREFEHYFLRSTWIDTADSGWDLTLSGDVYQASERDIQTWSLDLEKQISDKLELSFGSYYSLYKYDMFLEAERDDVRSYHADLKYAWKEDLMLDLDYVYEDDDLDNQHTIRLGLRWSF